MTLKYPYPFWGSDQESPTGNKDEIRTDMIVGKFGFAETSAKRYLRQLTEFGYLEARGGNRNINRSRTRKNKTGRN